MNGSAPALFKTKSVFVTFAQCEALLRHYAAIRCLSKLKLLHGHSITSGLLLCSPDSTRLRSKFASSYALCGHVLFASELFDELPRRSLFLWNSMMRMYVESGMPHDALKMFALMLDLGKCCPDKFTYPFLIKACSELSMLEVGVVIHGRALMDGFGSDTYVQNSLMAMYMNCGDKEAARQVFDVLRERSVVSWNTIISGYFQNGSSKEALIVFKRMMDENVEPDCATVVSVLPACGCLKELEWGRKVHALVRERRLGENIAVSNALVDMYAKCGSMAEAWVVFEEMGKKDVVSWTSMINGYILNADARSALALCQEMQMDGITPNSVTVACLLSACASLNNLRQGRSLHGWTIRRKLESDVMVETALIDLYAKCNYVNNSFQVFGRTSKRRTVPWNAILSGCIENGLGKEAVELFRQMLLEAVEPNNATLKSLIPAYAILADLKPAKNIHSYLIRSGFISQTEALTGLVNVYSKCGSLDSAHKIFCEIPEDDRDIVAWSAIIAAYGTHGCGKSAVTLFNQMVQSGIKPNEVTFTSVLHACGHAGLVDEGLGLFKFMLDNYPDSPLEDHYTCIVDLLGRAGRLTEAYVLIKTMPLARHHSIWGALLGSCVIHENVELGEVAARKLFEMEPGNTGNYVLLAKIYAAAGRWRDAEKVRHLMTKIGLRKAPAHSLIEVGKVN